MKVRVTMRSGHTYDAYMRGAEAPDAQHVREVVEQIMGAEGGGTLVLDDEVGERWLIFRTREMEVVEIEHGGSDDNGTNEAD